MSDELRLRVWCSCVCPPLRVMWTPARMSIPLWNRRTREGRPAGSTRHAPGAGLLAGLAGVPLVRQLRPGAALAVPEDLLAVVAPVLDEDLGDLLPRRDTPRQVHARHVGLQALFTERGTPRFLVESDAERAKEGEVRVEAGEQVHPVRRDPLGAAVGAPYQHPVRRDALHVRAPAGAYLPGLDPVLEIGLEPVLDAGLERGTAVDQRHAGAGAETAERLLHRRILAADDHHVETRGEVRLLGVVRDVRQLFPRDAQKIGMVEVSGGQHQAVAAHRFLAEPGREPAGDPAIAPRGSGEPRVGAHPEPLGAGDPAVILERFLAGRLGPGAHQGMPAPR